MQKKDALATVPLFRGLSDNQLGLMAEAFPRRYYKPSEILFSEGEPASGFYILLSGRLKIYKLSLEGKEQILHIIEPGEPFAEVALFSETKFPAYAEAIEKSEVIFLSRNAFRQLIGNDPSIAMNMLAILSQRLKYFTRLIEDLSLKEVPQRFAAYLLFLAHREGSDHVSLGISKGQLASLLGTIPETLSRIITKMSGKGLIEVQGRKVSILDPTNIELLANGKHTF
ncbi:MAG: Crp/Fnr family transcriptional regulator [Syntrophorhabdaceae bacterium]|nr:Crp/Fnr family transcriptional regulator [Syntrophorhabdaceae bacterium]MDD4195386.1 Crp/Fnr family transcriptional regulator [Syntrophorhabdaceae bacterium]HOC45988.1 Crp/Fnr family transcriptional regulator [Syntrophorhabdaceae bacterium]